jgi:cyclic pyranopterin phosphate synthase
MSLGTALQSPAAGVTPQPNDSKDTHTLVDNYGRRMRKLRVSLLDTCNFRCGYCMPDKPSFTSRQNLLPADEINRIVKVLVDLGIEEVRLTGGEPTLRNDLVSIAAMLSDLPLKKLSLTSNGMLLGPLLKGLSQTRCNHLNISLDSLDRENFARLAKVDGLTAVLGAILRAQGMGFSVRVNMVVMRGLNDHEIFDFVEFAREHQVEVRFLELMAIGHAADQQQSQLVPAAEIRARLSERWQLERRDTDWDATAVSFATDSGARIGIIAPVTESFCHSCSRWRLGCDGILRACLMSTQGLQLRDQSEDSIRELAVKALGMKPRSGSMITPMMMHGLGG